ncbi:hypothetical protein SLA2020_493880 [Shorea laevis]
MASKENQWNKPSINKEDDDAFLYAMLLSTSHILPMVLNAAIELNVFDIIASRANVDGYMSTSEIASQLPTKNPDAPSLLDRMLRLLASHSLLTSSIHTCEDGRVERLYGLSPAAKFYVQNEDGGYLGSLALLSFPRKAAEVWFHLKDAILEEGNLFKNVYGISCFQYFGADPTLNTLFNKAMADLSGITMKKVLETYKGFEGVSLVVDVAGGTGATLNTIISKYPSIKGINFDLPHVIKQVSSYPASDVQETSPPYRRWGMGVFWSWSIPKDVFLVKYSRFVFVYIGLVRARSNFIYAGIEHVGGDMYESVPRGDAIMIKVICHNWSDGHCIKLLKNCNKALQQNGKVIIIDYLMLEAVESSDAAKYVSTLDNNMLVNLGGKERTEKEFKALSKSSGFSAFHVICHVYNVLGVIELHK